MTQLGRRSFALLFVCLLAAAPVRSASADILYTNLDPDGFSADEGAILGGVFPQQVALQFTVGGAGQYNVTEYSFPLAWLEGSNVGKIQLLTDTGGSPGSVIEELPAGTVNTDNDPHLYVVASSSQPLVSAGDVLWFAIIFDAADSAVQWMNNANGIMANVGNRETDGDHWSVIEDIAPGFEIDGDPTFSPPGVPEPASVVLASLGGGVMLLFARFRRQRAAA